MQSMLETKWHWKVLISPIVSFTALFWPPISRKINVAQSGQNPVTTTGFCCSKSVSLYVWVEKKQSVYTNEIWSAHNADIPKV